MLNPTAHLHQNLISLNVIKNSHQIQKPCYAHKDSCNRIYSCAMCQRTFSTFQLLGRHLQVDHSAPHTSPCTICNNFFLNRCQLQAHIRTEHSTTLYLQRGICNESSPTILSLLIHLITPLAL